MGSVGKSNYTLETKSNGDYSYRGEDITKMGKGYTVQIDGDEVYTKDLPTAQALIDFDKVVFRIPPIATMDGQSLSPNDIFYSVLISSFGKNDFNSFVKSLNVREYAEVREIYDRAIKVREHLKNSNGLLR